MRKQILVLLSAVGLAVSTVPASAQQPMGGKEKHGIKWSKTDGVSNTRKTGRRHSVAQVSGKPVPPGPNTMRVPPGPNAINLKAGKADQLRSIGSATSGAGAGKVNSGKASAGKKQTLKQQPLSDRSVPRNQFGASNPADAKVTLNPQPLPPGVHTLNPQPLPPGVHTSGRKKQK